MGSCNVSQITSVPIQVFSLSQHMHKTGTHMRSVITRGQQTITLQDIDYKNKIIVIMAHDNGLTYLSKMYNDEWMEEKGFEI